VRVYAYAIEAYRGGLTGATVLPPLGVEIAVLACSVILVLAAGSCLFGRPMAGWLRSGPLG
jgi:hypothetical protein